MEISDAGRRALAGDVNSASEMESAQKALAVFAPLSSARAEQIQTRLQEGFYSGREVGRAVVAGLAATFFGDGPKKV